MDVSIIIVNYNTKEMTHDCIESIFMHTHGISFEVILVDNKSTDGSVEVFSKDSRLVFIQSPANLGFGKANNLGYKRASGKYIFLLNSDTILLNNAIKLLWDAAEESPRHIACWGTLLKSRNGELIHSFNRFPSMLNDLYCECIKVPLHKLTGVKLINNSENKRIKVATEVDYLTGADLFIRNDVIVKYGLFDPYFFMYYEETDLQRRYKKEGYKSQVILGPEIIHLEGGSLPMKNKTLRRSLLILHSKLYYLKKWNSPFSYFFYRVILLIIRIPFLLFSTYSTDEKKKYLKLLLS